MVQHYFIFKPLYLNGIVCKKKTEGVQAGMMNRKQEPQLVGDANRVLVGRN